jgi:protein PhnA
MTIAEQLIARSGNKCELTSTTENLAIYTLPPDGENDASKAIYICQKALKQLEKQEELDPEFWKCLNESMWSEVPAVQVVAWRMLNRLSNETWAMEALDLLYLDDDTLAWAKATGDHENSSDVDLHRDCNGTILQTGDTIVLTKSLDVKGAQLNAKMGTAVKNIKLVADNTEQIEGKIEGQQIVILTKYVRKSS